MSLLDTVKNKIIAFPNQFTREVRFIVEFLSLLKNKIPNLHADTPVNIGNNLAMFDDELLFDVNMAYQSYIASESLRGNYFIFPQNRSVMTISEYIKNKYIPNNDIIEYQSYWVPFSNYIIILSNLFWDYHSNDFLPWILSKTNNNDTCYSTSFTVSTEKVSEKKWIENIIFDSHIFDYAINHNTIMDILINNVWNNIFESQCSSFLIPIHIQYIENKQHYNHQNIMLIHVDYKLKQVVAYLYEPHGCTVTLPGGEDVIDMFETSFAMSNFMYDYDIMVDRSSQIGLQTWGRDTEGYCVLISLFWLYMVLWYIESVPEEGEFDILQYVKLLTKSIKGLFNPAEFMQFLGNFSYLVINEYIHDTNNIDIMKMFNVHRLPIMNKKTVLLTKDMKSYLLNHPDIISGRLDQENQRRALFDHDDHEAVYVSPPRYRVNRRIS